MTEHVVYTKEISDDRALWECSCGRSGSSSVFDVDLHSDMHIDYDMGDSRTDTNSPGWFV